MTTGRLDFNHSTVPMSKEKRARDKLRAELRQKVVSLDSRVKTAANALGREHYSKLLAEAKLQLQRLN